MDLASLHYMSQTKTETVNGDLARRVLEFYISIGYDVKKKTNRKMFTSVIVFYKL